MEEIAGRDEVDLFCDREMRQLIYIGKWRGCSFVDYFQY